MTIEIVTWMVNIELDLNVSPLYKLFVCSSYLTRRHGVSFDYQTQLKYFHSSSTSFRRCMIHIYEHIDRMIACYGGLLGLSNGVFKLFGSSPPFSKT